jgi:NADH-ubiquinone oxidoreductase chain 5
MYTVESIYVYFVGVFAAILTAFYSFRLIYWIFFSKANFFKIYLVFINELNIFMLIAMVVLSFFSIFVGYVFFDSFLGIGSVFWSNSIYIFINNYTILDAEFSLFFVKYIPLLFTILGVLFFFFFNKYLFEFSFYLVLTKKKIRNIYYFFNKSIYFDNIFNSYFLKYIMEFSYSYIYKYVEKGVLEVLGPIFVYRLFTSLYKYIKIFNDGLIFNYIFIIIWFILYFLVIFELCMLLNFNLVLLINIFIFIYIIYIYKYVKEFIELKKSYYKLKQIKKWRGV